MAVLGNDDEIYGVKRKWENREFSSDCYNKPKYKRRKVSARRDFPKGFTKNLSPKVENLKSDYEPEKLEDDVLSQPIFEPPEKLEDDVLSQPIFEPPEKLEDDVLSQPTFEPLEKLEDDVLSQPIFEPPAILYARNDYPVVFYHVARKVFAKRDFPEAFYANSRRVEREESESELEELEEAIGSDDDKTEESKCESYNAGKMGLSESDNNQIVGSTMLVDSNRMMSGAGEERGDYVQHMLAFLDHMKATLMQKYSRKFSAH